MKNGINQPRRKRRLSARPLVCIALAAIIGFAVTGCDNATPINENLSFTVTFNADNGTAAATQTVSKGGKATKPANPTKANYNFVHWFNTATNNEWNFNAEVTANLTLKAKWSAGGPQIFTVTFNADNGTDITTQTVTEGGKATKPEDPTADSTKANYDFIYWFNTDTNAEWHFDTAVTSDLSLKARWVYKSPLVQMVYVGGGDFEMGQNGAGDDNDIVPVHIVTLRSDYYIGKYEVTQKEWETVMGSLPKGTTDRLGKGDDHPVYFVNWYETLVFCNRLSIREGLSPAYLIDGETDPDEWGAVVTEDNYDDLYYDGKLDAWENVSVVYGSKGYRLPTEAQWEYAAKGGPSASNPYKIFSGSDTAYDVASFGGEATRVGSKAANELGLYDMSGSVFEWCWDWFDEEYYLDSPRFDPAGPFSGSDRVMRGGSYRNQALYARSVYRMSEEPEVPHEIVGFRIARPAQ